MRLNADISFLQNVHKNFAENICQQHSRIGRLEARAASVGRAGEGACRYTIGRHQSWDDGEVRLNSETPFYLDLLLASRRGAG